MPFTPYLNTNEINTLIEQFSIDFASICSRIILPNLTHEGRNSYALKLAAGTSVHRKGLLLLGGTHAREWGGSDILISLAEKLLNAYTDGTGITFQGKSYSVSEITKIMEHTDIFIFPNVNPDGKVYCQGGTDWRKNRRPTASSVGIDINRNYDFLWDANNFFDPSLSFSYLYSESSSTYHGSSAFSEAETQNVKWLVDNYPNIAYGVDIHSYGQKIMYMWGDDENQTSELEKNFMNPAYNASRGISSDSYGEFLFDKDRVHIENTATRMHNALFAVRGKSYSTGQLFHQVGVDSGSSASYFFSRHFSNPSTRKLYSYGIEFGTTFQPAPSEMLNVMDDIGAALTELCLCASDPDLLIRDNLSDEGKEPSTGLLCMSPDIICRKTPVANPGTAFADPAIDPGSDNIEIGNDNYIYIRVHNHGGIQTNAQVRLYFAPLTTSCSPTLWQFIDQIDVIDIPADGFKVSDAIIWPHVPDPGSTGHFCLIAVCGNSVDPFPNTSMIDSTNDYLKFIMNSNNIAYRNVVFEDIVPDSWKSIRFVVQGFRHDRTKINIEFETKNLPRDSNVKIVIKRHLLPQFLRLNSRLEKLLIPVRSFSGKTQKFKTSDYLKIPSGKKLYGKLDIKLNTPGKQDKQYSLAISQHTGQLPTGQFTLYINYKH
ncbi:MAG: hypothetical protein K9H26_15420 [Prolixibacteraceae bacterium]|nr:hypothetical protein [Prolixibacteraceae bacterium]